MSAKRLRLLGFDANLLQKLNKNNLLTCKDVLSKTEIELMNILNVSIYVVRDLLGQVARACAPAAVTALELYETRRRKQLTSLTQLDTVLRGGLPAGSITDVAGPAGCGKTQFCLMLSVIATLSTDCSTVSAGVIYIDTEMTFSPQRLLEIAIHRLPVVFAKQSTQRDLLSRVHVYQELTCHSLINRLNQLEECIVTHGARLVVIDSLAAVVRKEFDAGICHNMAERSNLLAKIAATLKQTAEALNIPIITTNQITTHFNRFSHDLLENVTDDKDVTVATDAVNCDSSYVTVALGNTWSHCVNTRLIVQYVDKVHRQLLVAKSPVAPFTSFIYTINVSGIVLQSDGAHVYDGTDPGRQHICVKSAAINNTLCS